MITPHLINKAMMRPFLILGVEKRLFIANALLSLTLFLSTHFKIPVCLIGLLLFIILHIGFRQVSQYDPCYGLLFKRNTRYIWRPYFPAKSYPLTLG